ncbi:MAG: hypothetical protein RR609_09165, partial [Aurantimicrobium sp.]
IDVFNKAYAIPTAEQIAEEKARFEKERLTLKGQCVSSGKQLGRFVESASASMFTEAVEMVSPSDEIYARLSDYCREYADCAELYSSIDRLAVYEDFDGMLKELKESGITLVAAVRDSELKVRGSDTVVGHGILYVVAFQSGREIEELAVPRNLHGSFM